MNINYSFHNTWAQASEPLSLEEKTAKGLFLYTRPHTFPAQPSPLCTDLGNVTS